MTIVIMSFLEFIVEFQSGLSFIKNGWIRAIIIREVEREAMYQVFRRQERGVGGWGNQSLSILNSDMVVSNAQVLLALELALVIGADTRGGGCSDDSSWSYNVFAD